MVRRARHGHSNGAGGHQPATLLREDARLRHLLQGGGPGVTIVLYEKTRSYCAPCKATSRRLATNGVEPVRVAVDDDSPTTRQIVDELKADGFLESPVVKIIDEHGQYVDSWSGYRPDKIDQYTKISDRVA